MLCQHIRLIVRQNLTLFSACMGAVLDAINSCLQVVKSSHIYIYMAKGHLTVAFIAWAKSCCLSVRNASQPVL